MPEELRLVPRMSRESSLTARDVAAVCFRQRRIITIAFGATLAAFLFWGIFLPSYQAEMTILVRRGRFDPVVTPTPSQATQIDRGEVTAEEMNSEAELLKDDEIVATVVKNLGSMVRSKSWLGKPAGDSDERELAGAVRRLSRNLDVTPIRKSTLIRVSYSSSDPQLSAEVLRALANAYLQRHQQVRRPSGEFHFFEEQMLQSRGALEQAEFQLMAFTHGEGVVSAGLERDIALQKASNSDSNQRETLLSVVQMSERVAVLKSKIGTLPERTTTQIRSSDNPLLLEKMKSTLLDLQLKRTNLLAKFQPSYRTVQEVDEQIAKTKASIASEAGDPVREQFTELDPNHEWVKAQLMKSQVELAALQARVIANGSVLTSYRKEAKRLGDSAIQQEELLRNVKAAEEKYLLYVNKREEARIGDALDEGGILNVAVVQKPKVPALPQHSTLAFGLIGMVFATVLSTGLGFTADYLDPTFRTPDEITAHLGFSVIASLPAAAVLAGE